MCNIEKYMYNHVFVMCMGSSTGTCRARGLVTPLIFIIGERGGRERGEGEGLKEQAVKPV